MLFPGVGGSWRSWIFAAAFKFPPSNVKSATATLLPTFHSIDSFHYASILESTSHNPAIHVKINNHASQRTIVDHSADRETADEQTSVILRAVDEKLSTQNRRIDGVERKVDKVITQLDAVLKKSEDLHDEDVSGAEQLRRHDDQLQDHAVRIKKMETVRNP